MSITSLKIYHLKSLKFCKKGIHVNYGLQIRETRKKLGLTQTHLTSSGISRVYITDLESGKAILEPDIPNKVERAYQISMKLMYFSLVKDIHVEINFDDLFPKDHLYFISKACYETIISISDNETEASLKALEDIYLNQPIDYLKFFLLKSIGEVYEKLKLMDNAIRVYRLALRSFKYKLVDSFVDIYKSTLYNYLFLVDDIDDSKEIVDLFEFVLSYSMAHNISLKNYDYYNMALFSLKAFAYEEGLGYIEQQEKYYSSGLDDDVSYKIIKTGLLQGLGKYDEAHRVYKELMTYDSIDSRSKLLIHSNYINFIAKYAYNDQLLRKSMDVVEAMIQEDIKVNHYTYGNLGQGYFKLKEYEKAYDQFTLAFKDYKKSDNVTMHNYLTLITEAYLTYTKLHKCYELIDYLKVIELDDLHSKEKTLLMEIIINLLYDGCKEASVLIEKFNLSYKHSTDSNKS